MARWRFPPPKKSMLDKARNAIARTAAQIRTGHWLCTFTESASETMTSAGSARALHKMTRSHVLSHCKNQRLRSARLEAWEGKEPGGVRVLLANPRWERLFVRFLGVGRWNRRGIARNLLMPQGWMSGWLGKREEREMG